MNESEEKKKIRVLVVDDASFMVRAVGDILASDPDIEVIGSARNGLEGLEKIKELNPDVITLDVDMPVMDGIRTVRHIMIESPVPVVMLSSLFSDGAITFEALRLGVVDFVPKPSGAISQDIHNAKQAIIDRVKIGASLSIHNMHRVRLMEGDASAQLDEAYSFQPLDYIVAIGTTLGGPNTVMRLLVHLSPKVPGAVVVVQEINPKILKSFVKKFDEHVPWKVDVAVDGTVLEQGTCYIASNETTVEIGANDNQEAVLIVSERCEEPLNRLFNSAANVFEKNAIGVLLTGVGSDGADGFGAIREKNGVTIAQATETCVYPNLTEYAIERGTVDYVVEERDLASQIEEAMSNF